MKVVTAEQMRNIDRSAASLGLTTEILMDNAGRAVARETKKFVGDMLGKRVLVMVGPGNNGGDGIVAALYLSNDGAECSLYLCTNRPSDDKNLVLAQEQGIPVVYARDDNGLAHFDRLLASSDVVIDAIFGTGKSRVIGGVIKQAMDKVIVAKEKRPKLSLVAVDMPSGLDADTGAVDITCPDVDITVTLGYPKPGLFIFPGAGRAGKVIVADIGIPPILAENINTELIAPEWVASVLPKRPAEANKGTFGRVLAVAGSVNYIGAAYLACMGAARAGAGLVTLSTAKSLQPILATNMIEVTYAPLPEAEPGIVAIDAAQVLDQFLPGYDVLMMGCGLGQNPNVMQFIRTTMFGLSGTSRLDLVLDADALNTLAQVPEWWQKLSCDAILTPHPGEMARLLGISTEDVQQQRLETTRNAAIQWHKVIVLKGAYTIVAAPDGSVRISEFANPGLASAGTGDVLSGVIAGLLAQGLSQFDAAACGVYLHGKAGDVVSEDIGDTGMLAGDLLPALPRIIKALKQTDT